MAESGVRLVLRARLAAGWQALTSVKCTRADPGIGPCVAADIFPRGDYDFFIAFASAMALSLSALAVFLHALLSAPFMSSHFSFATS